MALEPITNKTTISTVKLSALILLLLLLAYKPNALGGAEPVFLNLTSTASIVTYGNAVTLNGTVTPAHEGERISLIKTPSGGSPQTVQIAQSASGTYSYSEKPQKNTTYQAFFNHESSTVSSNIVNVKVRPTISLSATKSSFYLGDSSKLTVGVAPNRNGAKVIIQRYYPDGWKNVHEGVLNTYSKLSYTFKPSIAKSYYFRAIYIKDNEYMANTSSKILVIVKKPFIGLVYSDNTLKTSPQGPYYTSRVNATFDVLSTEFTRYAIRKLNDTDVARLSTLRKYKVVIFVGMTSVSKSQREAIRAYVRLGGKIIASFGLARNDSDGTPLIVRYGFKHNWDLSRFWEWEELSEVYQLKFNNDPLMEANYRVNSGSSVHPIIARTKRGLNLSNLTMTSPRPDYNELNWKIARNSNVVPILFFDTKGNRTSADDLSHGFGAAWVSKYYKGTSVYFNFMLHDFFWDSLRKSKGKNETISRALLINTVKWLRDSSTKSTITKSTNPTALSWLSGSRSSGYKLNVRHTVGNIGNIQLRGKFFIEIYRNGSLAYSGQTAQPVPLGSAISWTYNSWLYNIGNPGSTTFGVKVGSYYFDAVRGGTVKATRYYTYNYSPGKLSLVSVGPVVISK